jgi:hypothetical protein
MTYCVTAVKQSYWCQKDVSMSNKYNLKKQAAYQGITIIFYRSENKYEIHDTFEGKLGRVGLAKTLCEKLNIHVSELAMMYTEFEFNPDCVRAEFGINGQFLFVD